MVRRAISLLSVTALVLFLSPSAQATGQRAVRMAAADANAYRIARLVSDQPGQAANLDPDVAAKLLEFAQMAIPDTFRGPEGQAPVGAAVDVSESAPVADRLAGFLGRTP